MSKLDRDLLDRYLARRCTPAERERLERWLAESPVQRQALDDLQSALALADETAEPAREAAILASLRKEWGAPAAERHETHPPPEPRRFTLLRAAAAPRWFTVAQMAAAAAVIGAVGLFAGRAMSRAPAPSAMAARPAGAVVSTARGERRVLTLSDGTVVVLAPASSLRWSPDYGVKDRHVELDGEAVFTVVHDADRPFAVHTPHAVARDLGTRFAVRAYPGSVGTDVVVAEGMVAAAPGTASLGGADSVVLRRGDRATFGRAGVVAVGHDVALDDFFAWTAGRLVFRDIPLRDVVAQLSRWYDIDIRYDDERLGARSLSASFSDEPGSEALRVVAAILDLRVSRTGRVYTLQAR